MHLLIDASGHFPLTTNGEPLLLDTVPPGAELSAQVEIRPGVYAARMRGVAAGQLAEKVGDARSHPCDPLAARALGLVAARERYRFDPRDGSPLTWGQAGIVARGVSGEPIFPRVDPSVIGLVQDPSGERVLLAENSRRPGYFTAIAGYVDVGESIEAAFAREVLEETGRRVRDARYVCSQPWPASGALMLGFVGVTDDLDPVGETDGELRRIIWARREDLPGLTLAGEGTIARILIEQWAAGKFSMEGATSGD
ncbi:hypothetical protein A0K93_00275 [Corynebacterium sp. BCW_4722]|nr:hypothetical protein A0K93_00275 [Corynebacterium sp. BCW_4722]